MTGAGGAAPMSRRGTTAGGGESAPDQTGAR